MIYRFGDCEVDTNLLELRRRDAVQRIDPLGFDLLVYLLENRDRVLTRDELFEVLWPGKVVTDSVLSSRLKGVRAAVGDTGATQAIIKTVHGRGYRFVADLHEGAPVATGDRTGAAHNGSMAHVIGREAELGRLQRWQQLASGGDPQIVLIGGEAGVGKTTLTRAFTEFARLRLEALILHGQCVNEHGASEAFMPLLEAFGRAGTGADTVLPVLRRHAPAWLAHLPALANAAHKSASPPVAVTAGRMLRELSDTLNHLAHERDVILILEDLHWSDPSTVQWLDYHARRHDAARLMIIATARPEGPHQTVVNELALRGHMREMRLIEIDEADISDYLAHRLGRPPAPQLASLTYRRTEGFPLFIDALVERWLELGVIRKSASGWVAVRADEDLLAAIPDSLAQLIDQQLDELSEDERRLLETASLAGSPFAAAAVAAAVDAPEEDVESGYSRLARAGRMVRNDGEQQWPDGTVTATFDFRHELYREALRERVPASRRARLHAALGTRLAQASADSPDLWAGQIADHFARAHNVVRALEYFYPAALVAFRRSANRETLVIVERALELLGSVAPTADIQRIERQLHLLRASALGPLEGWASQRIEASYLRARELGKELALDDTAAEVIGIAAMQEVRGYYRESQVLLERLLNEKRVVGLEAYELLACSLFHQGRFADSKDRADRVIARYDPDEVSAILARYGENPGVCCHGWAAQDLWFMGYSDAALRRSDEGLRLAQEHTYSLATALTHRTFLHQFRDEPVQTVLWAQQAKNVASKEGYEFRIWQIAMLEGWANARLAKNDGKREEALAHSQKALAAYQHSGAKLAVPYYMTLEAETLAGLGQTGAACALLKTALAMCGPGRGFFYEAEMRRLYARLVRDKGEPQQAAAMLERALHVARAQNARFLEMRACVTRMEILDGPEIERQAQTDLRNLLADMAEGQDTPDWRAASAYTG